MTALITILGILYLVVCVVVSIIILMQEPKQQGISVVTGESESFFGKIGFYKRGKTHQIYSNRCGVLCNYGCGFRSFA